MIAYRAEDISQRLVPHDLYVREEFENSVQYDVSFSPHVLKALELIRHVLYSCDCALHYAGCRAMHFEMDQEVCETSDQATGEDKEKDCKSSCDT